MNDETRPESRGQIEGEKRFDVPCYFRHWTIVGCRDGYAQVSDGRSANHFADWDPAMQSGGLSPVGGRVSTDHESGNGRSGWIQTDPVRCDESIGNELSRMRRSEIHVDSDGDEDREVNLQHRLMKCRFGGSLDEKAWQGKRRSGGRLH